MAVSTITPGPTLAVPPPTSHGPLGRLGLWTASHFRLLRVVWAIVAVGLGAFAPRVDGALNGAGWEASGSESVQACDLVQQQFGGLLSTADPHVRWRPPN